jgi:D-threo-aldose 1-dehydrogenase
MVHGEAGNARHLADLCGSGLRALDRLRSDGTISAWGLGVNEVAICQTMLDRAQMDMILLAGRYTLLDGKAGTDLFGRCIAEGVSILLGGVFNSGILASGAVPGARYQYRPASEEMLEKTRQIEAVCAAHGVPLSAAALQFGRGHAAVASILIGTSSPASLHRNLDDLARPIPAALWRDLAAAGLARHHELVSA